jgi:hypothetical protein
MAAPTGKGKVESLPIRHSCTHDEIPFRIYNFNIGDHLLKPEHEQWLRENVVPLLTVPGLLITLRGQASRTGSDSFNKILSEKRIKSVEQFLLDNGARKVQFNQTAVGEEDAKLAGQADGTEDEKFRAVILTLKVPQPTTTPRFDRFDPNSKEDGFDATVDPPWVMVRYEDKARLMRVLDAQGMTLVSTNPAVAVPELIFPVNPRTPDSIGRQSEIFMIRVGVPGEAEIQVKDHCGNIRARLSVSVLEKLIVKTAIHYVKNANYGTRTRNLGDETGLVDEMNGIYGPQANLEFEVIQARDLPMTNNLGNQVNFTPISDWNTVVGNRNSLAQFNVFFVRELEEGAEPPAGTVDPTDDADALTNIGPPGDCIFEDSAGVEVGETLAHEAGHMLTIRHATPIRTTEDMLMWDFTDDRGRFIPRAHVLQMRRAVRP